MRDASAFDDAAVADVWDTLPAAPAATSPIVWGADLRAIEIPEITSHFEQAILPVGGLMVIHGSYKSYKTFTAIDLMIALATGRDWACFKNQTGPQKVCIVQFEVSLAGYRDRLDRRYHRLTTADQTLWDENLGTWTPGVRPQLMAEKAETLAPYLEWLQREGVTCVLVDPIRRGMTGDFNSEKEVRPVLEFFRQLQDLGITVIATHHDNKGALRVDEKGKIKYGGGSPGDMTGSGAFAGDPDTIVSIARINGSFEADQRRNTNWLLREASSPYPRGFTMGAGKNDGFLEYDDEPHHDAEADETPERRVPRNASPSI